jgi:putative tryptophan/tyrosine transport system substrate-binding protein
MESRFATRPQRVYKDVGDEDTSLQGTDPDLDAVCLRGGHMVIRRGLTSAVHAATRAGRQAHELPECTDMPPGTDRQSDSFPGRRGLLAAAAIGLVAMAGPVAAQTSVYRLAWLGPGKLEEDLPLLQTLREGLSQLGYVEGHNLRIDIRSCDHSPERVASHVAAVIADPPNVIVTFGPPIVAVRRATQTIPVVFAYSGDPVQAGLVESFARPAWNCTGISFLALHLVGKRIDLLKSVMPGLRRIAIVASPQHPGDPAERRVSEAAARAIGVEVEYFELTGAAQFDGVLEAVRASRNEAVLMFPVQLVISNSARIAAWSLKAGIPAASGWSRFATEGNLMSYGANMGQSYRRLATFVDRIFKGAKPAELAVEVPHKFELVVNLRCARALHISVPQAVLFQADQLIE